MQPIVVSCLTAVGLSSLFAMVLFGLHQYKARDRAWGARLVVGASAMTLTVGWVCWVSRVFVGIAVAIGLVIAVGAWVDARRLSGWRRHLLRGLGFAVPVGPWMVFGKTEIALVERAGVWVSLGGNTIWFWMLYVVPGIVWVGVLAAGASWWLEHRAAGTRSVVRPPWSRRRVLGFGLGALVVCLGANWYAAGLVNLCDAADAGDAGWMLYAVFSRPGSAFLRNRTGETLLCRAAEGGHLAAVRTLLLAGVDVNARTMVGETALHYAAASGRLEAVKLLLAAGAAVDAKSTGSRMTSGPASTPLHLAAARGDCAVVKVLLRAGADVNAVVDSDRDGGLTPLHWTASATVAEALVEARARVDTKTRHHGRTPLNDAAHRGDGGVIAPLLAGGADVNARDKEGWTPLDVWCSLSSVDIETQKAVEELLRQHGGKTGAELDAAKKSRMTALPASAD